MDLMHHLASRVSNTASRWAGTLDAQVGKVRAITSILLFTSGWFLFERVRQANAAGGLWGASHLDVNAEAHSGVMGVLAGFIVAVIIILLTASDHSQAEGGDCRQRDDAEQDLKLGATATFLCAFLLAILGSFQYASFVGYADDLISHPSLNSSLGHTLLDGFGAYLFSILGVSFLLTVYLCFYGLLMVVAKFIQEQTIRILTHSLLAVVYLLGSMWVFLDFAGAARHVDLNLSFTGIALYYLGIVATAGIWPLGFPRTSPLFVRRLLFTALGLTVVLASSLGVVYAERCFEDLNNLSVYDVRIWIQESVWIVGLALGTLFAIYTFCLDRMVAKRDDGCPSR